jgi:hypothetical protein
MVFFGRRIRRSVADEESLRKKILREIMNGLLSDQLELYWLRGGNAFDVYINTDSLACGIIYKSMLVYLDVVEDSTSFMISTIVYRPEFNDDASGVDLLYNETNASLDRGIRIERGDLGEVAIFQNLPIWTLQPDSLALFEDRVGSFLREAATMRATMKKAAGRSTTPRRGLWMTFNMGRVFSGARSA